MLETCLHLYICGIMSNCTEKSESIIDSVRKGVHLACQQNEGQCRVIPGHLSACLSIFSAG